MNKIKYDEPINIFVSTNEEFTHKAFYTEKQNHQNLSIMIYKMEILAILLLIL